MSASRVIGSGLQFRVVDLGVRVEKRPADDRQIRARLLRSRPALLLRPWRLSREVHRLKHQRDEVLKELAVRPIEPGLLGNLEFRNGRLLQDKLTPFGEVLRHSDAGQGARWIDAYVKHTLLCLKNGFVESSFNFTVNHGVDRSNRVVVLDVGELAFDLAYVLDQVRSRFWLRAWSYRSDLSDELQNYFASAMDEALTPEVVRDRWPVDSAGTSSGR